MKLCNPLGCPLNIVQTLLATLATWDGHLLGSQTSDAFRLSDELVQLIRPKKGRSEDTKQLAENSSGKTKVVRPPKFTKL